MPMRLSFEYPANSPPQSAVLQGLGTAEPPVVPEWARPLVGTQTWTGAKIELAGLRRAFMQFAGQTQLDRDRSTMTEWTCDDDPLDIDMTLPLLLLARDLMLLGQEEGQITLGGG